MDFYRENEIPSQELVLEIDQNKMATIPFTLQIEEFRQAQQTFCSLILEITTEETTMKLCCAYLRTFISVNLYGIMLQIDLLIRKINRKKN